MLDSVWIHAFSYLNAHVFISLRHCLFTLCWDTAHMGSEGAS